MLFFIIFIKIHFKRIQHRQFMLEKEYTFSCLGRVHRNTDLRQKHQPLCIWIIFYGYCASSKNNNLNMFGVMWSNDKPHLNFHSFIWRNQLQVCKWKSSQFWSKTDKAKWGLPQRKDISSTFLWVADQWHQHLYCFIDFKNDKIKLFEDELFCIFPFSQFYIF